MSVVPLRPVEPGCETKSAAKRMADRARAKPTTAPGLPAEPPPRPSCEPVTLMELTLSSCRWPIGDGPFLFCGALEADGATGRSYCPYHHALAYTPAPRPHRRAPTRLQA
jgi:GcrA cell cycle regulator